jgi:hypothetical protein
MGKDEILALSKRRYPESYRKESVASFMRACVVRGIDTLDRFTSSTSQARRKWGSDRDLELILRAPVSPTTIATGAPMAHITMSLLHALVPVSAGADLLSRGSVLSFDGAAQISVPGIALPTTAFIAEGQPIPAVTAPTNTGATLVPHKLATITSLTGEMLRNSNAESLVRQVLLESVGPAVDKVLFGTAAAGAAPPGLLNGIAALTQATGTDKSQIIIDDMQALALSVAPVAGNGEVIIVASPDVAVALKLRLYGTVQWPVLTSGSLAAKTVIAIAANAVVDGEVIRTKTGFRDHPLLKHELGARNFVCRTLSRLGLNVEPVRGPGRPGSGGLGITDTWSE